MDEERTAGTVRASVTLQGGGRLAGVSQVLDVKLEPKQIEWKAVDERTVAVRGEIHSYMYFLRSGSREIQGEGLSIPFARTVEAPGLAGRELAVHVEELQSDYDYDPVTTEFRHRIRFVLSLRPRDAREERSVSLREPAGEALGGAAAGETRISQVRAGPSPLESRPADEPGPVPSHEEGRPAEEAAGPPGTRGSREAQGPGPAAPPEQAKKPPLQWRPFPPPIQQ